MTSPSTDATHRGDFVDANGVRTYFEVDGAGEPLVLVHGGLCAIETLAGLRSELARSYRVYMPERRGHGRTRDVEGPFSYERFAEDTIAFMEAVNLESAHFVGFSDGATISLLIALSRPDLVRTLVYIGQQINPGGLRPEFQQMMKLDAMPQGMLPPMLRELYASLSPDGADHWDVIIGKAWPMMTSSPNIETATLAAVAAPTLVMIGDDDIVSESHAKEIAEAIRHAELVVVPNATHAFPMEQPDTTAKSITSFISTTNKV